MSESSLPDLANAFSIPILLKAVDFLFAQGKSILEERRERRKASLSKTDESQVLIDDLKIDVKITDSVRTKEEAVEHPIDRSVWEESAAEVEHLVSLLDIYRQNYYHAKEKYAKWGSAMAPQIIVHELAEAEDQVASTVQALQTALGKIYSKSLALHPDKELKDGAEEKGFLDFAVEGHQATEVVTETVSKLSEAMTALSQDLASQTERLNKLQGPGRASEAYKIAAVVAQGINNFAKKSEEYRSNLQEGISLLRDSVSGLILWVRIEGDEIANSLTSYRDSISSMRDAVERGSEGVDKFLGAARGLRSQGISRSINQACSRLIVVLENIIQTFDSLEDFCTSTITLINQKLANFEEE